MNHSTCAKFEQKWCQNSSFSSKATPCVEHPPYAPDLAPHDFFFIPKVKSALKGTRFASVKAVEVKQLSFSNS